jgi:hypothetical protein
LEESHLLYIHFHPFTGEHYLCQKYGKTNKLLILLWSAMFCFGWLQTDWPRIGQDCTLFYRSYTQGLSLGSVLCLRVSVPPTLKFRQAGVIRVRKEASSYVLPHRTTADRWSIPNAECGLRNGKSQFKDKKMMGS